MGDSLPALSFSGGDPLLGSVCDAPSGRTDSATR
jgi:hypothetical protein